MDPGFRVQCVGYQNPKLNNPAPKRASRLPSCDMRTCCVESSACIMKLPNSPPVIKIKSYVDAYKGMEQEGEMAIVLGSGVLGYKYPPPPC